MYNEPLPSRDYCDPDSLCSSKRLVLVVDDDPHVVRILELRLARAGYRTLAAGSASEAMQLLLEHHPPIVIADWNMPEMSGLDLCRKIRETPAVESTYFIILTADTGLDRVVQGFDAGVNDYLAKSLDPRELLGRLKSAWRIVRLEQTLNAKNAALERANRELAVANLRLKVLNERLAVQATTDELTGLLNRRAALSRVEELFTASCRYDQPIACLSVDVDHFKRVNDNYGHDVGDTVLRQVARTMREQTRESDLVCRLGGEEFLIVCPSTGCYRAVELAERLRSEMERLEIICGSVRLRVTVSIGVAHRAPHIHSVAALIKASDDALYAAKHGGRNTVRIAFDPDTDAAS